MVAVDPVPAVQVRVVDDLGEAVQLRDAGWCPVECSFGEVSVVDELDLDHHGALAGLEPVGLRAWRDLHGRRRRDPRFVTAGGVDADAGFAMAALAGLVPAPTDADIARTAAIVELIAVLDVDPIGREVVDHPGFGYLKLWSMLHGGAGAATATAAVLAWPVLCTRSDALLAPLVGAARGQEQRRRELAEEQRRSCRVAVDGLDPRVLVLDGATVWGFDVWYDRDPDRSPTDPQAWGSPVVLSRTPAGSISVGLPNDEIAATLLGEGGLLNVFPALEPAGWGGRAAIGGSPRGQVVDAAVLVQAASTLAAQLRPPRG